MDDTGNVVAFNVVQVSEVTSSNPMEKEGFSRCIEMLESKDVTISRIATDHHVSISSSSSNNTNTGRNQAQVQAGGTCRRGTLQDVISKSP